MSATENYIFIGGRDRGFTWLDRMEQRGALPSAVYCLEEDAHEVEKYSPQIQRLCADRQIPCRLRKRLRAEDEAEIIERAPALIVVMGWRSLISERVLAAPKFGSVGLHESLLPAYRGFAPVNWAVINGETQTGVSLFYLTSDGVDDGDIVDQRVIPIRENDTAGQVYERTSSASLELLEAHFGDMIRGDAPRRAQDASQATYTCARTPQDGWIDWTQDSRVIHNLVRGLAHPYPGAWTEFDGAPLRICRTTLGIEQRRYAGRISGRVIGISKAEGFVDVLAADWAIRLLEVQRAASTPCPAAEVISSVKATLGPRRAASI
jgi:methionyl-tRNA formyltransferase